MNPSCLHRVPVNLSVNGRRVALDLPPSTTLADLLRDGLGLTGTKVACHQAACGACTVQLDGAPVFACHTLAVQVRGREVRTVEGLSDGDVLHPLQQAFVECDALQCGFCTPGMLMALAAAIDAGVAPTREALGRAVSGNVCRCGAYDAILEAARVVASRR